MKNKQYIIFIIILVQTQRLHFYDEIPIIKLSDIFSKISMK
jgi:hypothetical protein